MKADGSWTDQVARNFNSASGAYAANARIQRQIADLLGAWIEARTGSGGVRQGLEIGCGTGFLTGHLLTAWPDAGWLITDIAPGMVGRCQSLLERIPATDVRFAVRDGQSIELATGSLDLIASSLTFQWFARPLEVVQRLLLALRPGGWLIFSTLGPGTFRTASKILKTPARNYATAGQLKRALQSSATTCLVEQREFVETTQCLRSLMQHLKTIGAATPLPGGQIRPSELRRAMQDSTLSGAGLPVEYEVLLVAIQR
jgi:malonyl-CoA O-methyltransferase